MNLNVNNSSTSGIGAVNNGGQTKSVTAMFADAKLKSAQSRGKPVIKPGGQVHPNQQKALEDQVRKDTGSTH